MKLPRYIIPTIFLSGFLIRLALIPNPGFEADITFWKSWGLAPFDEGLKWSLHNTNNNYPAPFAYLLWFITWIYSWFANPHNFNEFWNNSNLIYLTLIKMPVILADMTIAYIIHHIGKNPNKYHFPELPYNLYLLLATIYLFSPLSLLDGALWGQIDALGVCIFLIAIVAALKNKPFASGLIFMIAMMTKLQNMIYGPLLFLFIWQTLGWKGLMTSLFGALTGFVGLNAQLLWAKDTARVIQSLTENYDYFPLMSLNSYNVWWIIAKGNGMSTSDKLLFSGIINAKTYGLLLFSSSYLMAALIMGIETLKNWGKIEIETETYSNQSTIVNVIFKELNNYWTNVRRAWNKIVLQASREKPYDTDIKERATLKIKINDREDSNNSQNNISTSAINHTKFEYLFRFLIGLIIVNAAFFLFQTESHERYAFPISIFFLLLIPFIIETTTTIKERLTWWKTRQCQSALIGYIAYTGIYFINLHNALIVNYPANGITWLKMLKIPEITIPLSYIQIGLFVLFIFSLRKTIKLFPIIAAIICFFTATFILNYPLTTKTPISLTRLTPISHQQDYKRMVTNMPVNADGLDSKTWSRLSVQYVYYDEGIGTHANSTITYDVNKQFSTFETDFGIDTEAGAKGTALFSIYGDDKELFTSKKMGRYDYPAHAKVNIQGVQTLRLIVTDAGDGITDDHADWLRPTLIP